MKTYCEGSNCTKLNTCAKHQVKNMEICYEYIDWSTYGGGRYWTDAEGNSHCETWTGCGSAGDYKLYEECIDE